MISISALVGADVVGREDGSTDGTAVGSAERLPAGALVGADVVGREDGTAVGSAVRRTASRCSGG